MKGGAHVFHTHKASPLPANGNIGCR